MTFSLATHILFRVQVLQAEKGQKYSSGTQQLNFKQVDLCCLIFPNRLLNTNGISSFRHTTEIYFRVTMQVLLKSSAIDQLVEGCLNDSRSAEVSVYLARLFDAIAHAASPEGLASALVSVIISHSQLAAADPLFDCTQSRQVISGALNVIKAGLPNAQSGQKAAVKNLDDLSVKLEQLEAKLPNVSGLKEQVSTDCMSFVYCKSMCILDLLKHVYLSVFCLLYQWLHTNSII